MEKAKKAPTQPVMETMELFCDYCGEFGRDCRCIGEEATICLNSPSLCLVTSADPCTNELFVPLKIKIEPDIDAIEIKHDPLVAIPPLFTATQPSDLEERCPEFESVFVKEEPSPLLEESELVSLSNASCDSAVISTSGLIKTETRPTQYVILPLSDKAVDLDGSSPLTNSAALYTRIETKFNCIVCLRSFASSIFSKSTNLDHLSQKLAAKSVICNSCKLEKSQKANVDRQNYVEFTCEICMKSFYMFDKLVRHKKQAHALLQQKTLELRYNEKLHSSVAPESALSDCDVSEVTLANNLYSSATYGNTFGAKTSEVSCNICKSGFLTEHKLQLHRCTPLISEADFPTRFSDVTCETCDEKFNSTRLLAIHSQTHLADKVLLHSSNGVQKPNTFTGNATCIIDISVVTTCASKPRSRKQNLRDISKTCDTCKKVFETFDLLSEHSKTHVINVVDDDGIVQESNFSTRNSYKVLRNSYPRFNEKTRFGENVGVSNVNSLQCTICDKRFAALETLGKHEWSHVTRFECEFCKKLFAFKSDIKRHISTSHVAKSRGLKPRECLSNSNQCKICWKSFKSKKSVFKHKQIHNKQLECALCEKRFVFKSDIRRHMIAHLLKSNRNLSDSLDKRCPICKKYFETSKIRDQHKLTHEKRFGCYVCKKLFLYRCDLSRHLSNVHNRKTVDFMCGICGVHFSTKMDCAHHTLASHSPSNRAVFIKSFPARRNRNTRAKKFEVKSGFTCAFCLDTFSTNKLLRSHMRAHIDSYTCDYCNMIFTFKHSLRSHIVLHLEELCV